MKNNKGFARYELVTVIVLLLVVFAYLMNCVLGGASSTKIQAMKESALNFSKAVSINVSNFNNFEVVYLKEAYEEKVLETLKNPFGSGNCDESESKIVFVDGQPHVTLKCGNYALFDEDFSDPKNVDVYKVSNWSTKEIEDSEQKDLYNCVKDNKDLFNDYYEDLYLVSRINHDYNTSFYSASDVSEFCELEKKTFYRTKELVEKK